MNKQSLVALAVLAAAGTGARAADLFSVTFVDGTQTATRTYNNADAVFNGTSTAYIQQALPGYVSSDALTVDIRYLGLPAQVAFAAGSRTATLSIPSLGLNRSFTGVNRDSSVVQLQEFFRSGVNLGQVFAALVRTNAVDPGTRLLNRQAEAAFDDSFGGFGFVAGPETDASSDGATPASSTDGAPGTSSQATGSGLIGVGVTFSGTTYSGGLRQYMTSVPLSYTVRNGLEPRRQLTLSMNVSEYDVKGARTWSLSPGAAYAFPISKDWTVTPSVQYGYTQSSDLGTEASLITAAVSSSYLLFSDSQHAVVMGNMIGRAESIGLKEGGSRVSPEIGTTALRNGLMYSQPVMVMGRRLAVEASLINTSFLGTALFTQRYNELALTLGTNRAARTGRDYLRAGVKYQFSSTSHGLTAQLGYWF